MSAFTSFKTSLIRKNPKSKVTLVYKKASIRWQDTNIS